MAILCLLRFLPLGISYQFCDIDPRLLLNVILDLGHKAFSWLERGDKVLRNDQGGVPGNIAGSFLCSFLHYEAAESSKINVVTMYQALLNRTHEGFNGLLDSYFLDPGVLADFVNDVCFSHF